MIEDLGPGVDGVTAGDEVIGFTHERASQAELVAVDAGNLVRRPPAVPWEVAGALFVAGTTAWAAVRAGGAAALSRGRRLGPQAPGVNQVTDRAG